MLVLPSRVSFSSSVRAARVACKAAASVGAAWRNIEAVQIQAAAKTAMASAAARPRLAQVNATSPSGIVRLARLHAGGGGDLPGTLQDPRQGRLRRLFAADRLDRLAQDAGEARPLPAGRRPVGDRCPWSFSSLLNHLAGWEKGGRHHLCEAPSGPFRQMVPVTFFSPPFVRRALFSACRGPCAAPRPRGRPPSPGQQRSAGRTGRRNSGARTRPPVAGARRPPPGGAAAPTRRRWRLGRTRAAGRRLLPAERRLGPPPPLPQAIQGPMGDHAVQQRPPVLHHLGLPDPIGLEESLLDGVFGVRAAAQDAARQPKDGRSVIGDDLVPVAHRWAFSVGPWCGAHYNIRRRARGKITPKRLFPAKMFPLRKGANGFSGATAGLPSSVVGRRIGTAGQASSGTRRGREPHQKRAITVRRRISASRPSPPAARG